MTNNTYDYLCYRFFLVPENDQLTLFPNSREKIINEFIDYLKSNIKIGIRYRGVKYLLYLDKEVEKSVFICKLAREKHHTKYDEGELDLEPKEDIEFPFVFIVMDLKKQIVLVQKKTSVFQDPETSKRMLKRIIEDVLELDHFVFTIDEISDKKEFWDIVDNNDGIFSVELNLKSPNLFGSRYDANEFLKKQREIHNATETDVEFKNKHGKLRIPREIFDSFIEYISAGAGSYNLEYLKDGEKQVKSSSDNIKKVQFEEELDEKDPKKISDKITEIDENEG